MIKSEIRSLVRNSLPKIDKTNRWHDNFIDAAIEKAIALMYDDIFKVNPLNLQRYVKQYGYSAAIAVNTEAVTGIKYSTLPESIIPVNDKASGVRRISTLAQGALKFIPMDAREDLLGNGAYFNNVSTLIGYSVNQTRVEYYGMTNAIQAVGVRMDLLIPFSKYAETDEVKIPEVNDPRTGETFVDRVMKILGIVQPTDIKDDNSSSAQGKQTDN